MHHYQHGFFEMCPALNQMEMNYECPILGETDLGKEGQSHLC